MSLGSIKCEACTKRFGTQKGLSTHEQHAYPAVRYVKRRGTTDASKQECNSRVWSVKEVTFLREPNQKFENIKYSNVEIKKYLTSKTVEQIENKRKDLRNEHVIT